MTMTDRKPIRARRGVALIYTIVMLTTMLIFCSLAVDLARVQLAKSDLRRSVDAAARYGAWGLDTTAASATANAIASAAENKVDGTPLALIAAQDIQIGTWNAATHTFTALSGSNADNGNAVQVTGRRTAARGTAIPLSFASLIGQKTCNLNGLTAIAMINKSVNVNQNVPATANPFLAGMPYGSVASLNNPHNSPDYAGNSINPRQSPLQVAMGLTPGEPLTFDGITGDARHDPNLAYFSPDGELGAIGNNTNGSENGISDLNAPINALVGVFLSDEQPNKTPAPTFTASDLKKSPTDFSTPEARNMPVYQPKLKQLFFIGDGKTDDGVAQQFVAPPGATRLFLATWDFFEWNNNAGQRNVVVNRPASIALVK